jgi:PAS domain S-box-containing protein
LFAGEGEMRALCREFDWASTALGPSASWSHSLRATAGIVLNSRNPMFLFWGPELIQIYNDAYRPSLGEGGRHPRALGMRAEEFWTDIWDVIGPQIDQVMSGGDATWHEDQHIPIERNGRLEDVWWTYSYSPVRDDDGSIGGTLVVCQETTTRVLADRERAQSLADMARAERRTARILEQVSDAYLLMDASGTVVAVNAAAECALGIGRERIVGGSFWELFPSAKGSVVERRYRRVQMHGVEEHFTHHFVGAGLDKLLEIDAYPSEDKGIAIFWRDLTERRRIEAAREESEARLRAIYDGTYEYIGLITPDGIVLDCNRASLEFAGNRREDVVGRPFWETPWFSHTPGGPELLRRWIATAAAGEFVRREAAMTRPSGETMTFDFSLHPIRNEQGEVAFIVPEGRDISDRERLLRDLEVERARLANVFKQAPAFLAVLRGPQHVFELVNDAYYNLVGHRDLLGRPAFEALPEVRHQPFRELLDGVLSKGEPFVGRELALMVARTPGAPPEERFVDLIYMPLVEGDGTRSGVIAHGTDVTEQVLARREVERLLGESERARAEAEAAHADAEAARADAELARTEAEAANRAKSDFLAVMSHELRTPLNAIGGYAELLEMGIRGAVNEAQREDLRRIQNSQRHLLGVINEVLNYAKLETGTVQFTVTDVGIAEALGGAEALVAPQARAKKIALTVADIDPTLTVRADEEKLRQILVNLLSNAVKFTDRGGRIDLGVTSGADTATILVRDTGIGIAGDKLELIFEPFVQVRAEFTRTAEGTGLGLAISRDLARAMGGDLTAESQLGVGSTFGLTLRRA